MRTTDILLTVKGGGGGEGVMGSSDLVETIIGLLFNLHLLPLNSWEIDSYTIRN